jgi:hypothetical protein
MIDALSGKIVNQRSLGFIWFTSGEVERTDYHASYIGPIDQHDWQVLEIVGKWRAPNSEEIWKTSTALGIFLEDGTLVVGGFRSAGLSLEAKSEMIRRTLQLLQANPEAALQYLAVVYERAIDSKSNEPLSIDDLPYVQVFLKTMYKPGNKSYEHHFADG